jgi:hypothetical protein
MPLGVCGPLQGHADNSFSARRYVGVIRGSLALEAVELDLCGFYRLYPKVVGATGDHGPSASRWVAEDAPIRRDTP